MNIKEMVYERLTKERRSELYVELKKYLEKQNKLKYGDFVLIYEAYYFLGNPTKEEQEILKLLEKYEKHVVTYWGKLEMPLCEEDSNEDDTELENHPFIHIIRSITSDDSTLIDEMKECLREPLEYVKKHYETFEEVGIVDDGILEEDENIEEDDLPDIDEISWFTLFNLLVEHEYVAELDWKEELSDVIEVLQSLVGVKGRKLAIKTEWFERNAEMVEWFEILDDKWSQTGIALYGLDMDSDSYAVFPYSIKEAKQLIKEAEKMGCRISLAKDL